MMKCKLILISWLCLGMMKSQAQELLTVEQAVAAAMSNNYDIQLVKNDSVIASLNNSYAYTAFLPTANATAGVIFNNNNTKQKLADGSVKQRSGLKSSNVASAVNLNWTVFDGCLLYTSRCV